MGSQAGESGPTTSGVSGAEAVPRRRPWGKIAGVAIVIILILAALAILTRRANGAPTISRTTANPASAVVGDPVTFTAETADPDGDELSYLWDFGDGSPGTGTQPLHTYDLPGKFVVLLTVSDGKGGQATNDENLLRIEVVPEPADIAPPPSCRSATCQPGPVVAVLNADRWRAGAETPVAFDGNSSWAYAFSWTNSTNHSEGGTYSIEVASENATLFDYVRYVWGDGTANKTGNSLTVGGWTHTFTGTGNYFVQLTVTYANADLNPSAISAFAGFTVRVLAEPVSYAARVEGPPKADEIIAGSRFLAMAMGSSLDGIVRFAGLLGPGPDERVD